MSIEQIRTLIQNAKLKKALEATATLNAIQADEDLENTISLLQGQLAQNERDNRMGLIAGDESRRGLARITHALLSILSDIEDSEDSEENHQNPTPTPANNDRVASPRPNPPSNTSNTSANDDTTKVLFLAANPSNTAKLQLTKEHSRVSTKLQDAPAPEKFPLKFKQAVTPSQFAEYLFLEKPDIVHFSGHGDQENPDFKRMMSESRGMGRAALNKAKESDPEAGIFLLDEDQRHAQFVSTSFLRTTFKNIVERLKIPVQVVLFNACHSAEQAQAVSEIVPWVIGTSSSVKDTAAIAFATGFYFGVAQNMNIEDAFNFGIAQAIIYGEPEDRFLLYNNGQRVQF